MSSLKELALKRESCRNYLEKPIAHEVLTELVETAILAPSASNRQSWRFALCEGETAKKVAALCEVKPGVNAWAKNCPAFIVISSTTRQSQILDTTHEFPIVDAGIATAYLCLAATEKGLSTCIIGAMDETGIKTLLDIDPQRRVHCVVALGYGAEAPSLQKDRLPYAELVREYR